MARYNDSLGSFDEYASKMLAQATSDDPALAFAEHMNYERLSPEMKDSLAMARYNDSFGSLGRCVRRVLDRATSDDLASAFAAHMSYERLSPEIKDLLLFSVVFGEDLRQHENSIAADYMRAELSKTPLGMF